MNIDLLIVGAGITGCVIAERAASQGLTSLIVDKRSHIGGNCYDEYHPSGVLVHKYGPHLFRTHKPEIVDYLSRFTSWIEGDYRVEAFTEGEYFPIPINRTTLEKFFGRKLSRNEASELLESLRDKTITIPQNSEEFVLSRVGRELYEAFYLGYTLKQWEHHPSNLSPGVCGRIPVRVSTDWRYVNHKYQLMPKDGYTRMFSRMVSHPKIHLLLNTDYNLVRNEIKPKLATFYTGCIDEYFGYTLGKLPWRSLTFEFKQYEQEFKQHCVSVNYPNDFDYTRSVEIKHITKQKHPLTVVSYEYPTDRGDPYYPVPSLDGAALYAQYLEKAKEERGVFFAGRLATYSYLDMDVSIEKALEMFSMLEKENVPATEWKWM